MSGTEVFGVAFGLAVIAFLVWLMWAVEQDNWHD